MNYVSKDKHIQTSSPGNHGNHNFKVTIETILPR